MSCIQPILFCGAVQARIVRLPLMQRVTYLWAGGVSGMGVWLGCSRLYPCCPFAPSSCTKDPLATHQQPLLLCCPVISRCVAAALCCAVLCCAVIPLQPLPAESTIICEAEVESMEGRKIWLTARLTDTTGDTVYAASRALFVKPKQPVSLPQQQPGDQQQQQGDGVASVTGA
jgi:hypothetical protein